MTASMGTAFAEDGDMTQTRTQDRVRTEANAQTPASDFGQEGQSEQKKVMNQNQNQYRYMNNYRNGQSDTGASSMDRQNTMNRSMQDSSVNGSMNRQGTDNRSMAGGRR
jgi:hypothetical protein